MKKFKTFGLADLLGLKEDLPTKGCDSLVGFDPSETGIPVS